MRIEKVTVYPFSRNYTRTSKSTLRRRIHYKLVYKSFEPRRKNWNYKTFLLRSFSFLIKETSFTPLPVSTLLGLTKTTRLDQNLGEDGIKEKWDPAIGSDKRTDVQSVPPFNRQGGTNTSFVGVLRQTHSQTVPTKDIQVDRRKEGSNRD